MILKFVVGWPLSILALFFIFKIIISNSPNLFSYLKAPNIPLVAGGILCFLFYYALRAFSWNTLLKESGHNISLKESSYLWGFAELKRFIPGNIWSFLTKTISFEDKGIDKKSIAKLLFIEIGMFVLSCIIFSLLSLNFVLESILPSSLGFIHQLSIPAVILLTMFYTFNRSFIPKSHSKILNLFRFFLPDLKPIITLNLLLINLLFLFFYGLGYFLVISSVVTLPLHHSLSLLGFFVFSLLTGYLSFVTPMGLGVREGMVTLGLSKYLATGMAGFASIFVRMCLISTELIFISLIYLWKHTKNQTLSKAENYVSKNLHVILLSTFISIYILYFATISFLRYDNFFTGRFDLGNMEQAVWNTINGRIFLFTNPDGIAPISRLAFHADFILILLAPFYFVWEHAKSLLLIQTVVLAFGAIYVYLISKQLIKDKTLSLVLSASYLINPSVQLVNLYDFHPVVLATTLLLGAYYYLINKKYFLFSVFLLLASLAKEQMWVVTAIFGVYIFVIHKKKLAGSLLSVISLAIFYIIVSQIIPSFHGKEHFALSYYSEFGSSPFEIIRNIIFSPNLVLTAIFSQSSLDYLLKIFLPFGFLPFFNPFSLVFTIPDFAINLLSNNIQLRQIYYQYTAVITPFLFISTIYAIRLIAKKSKLFSFRFFTWYIFFFTLLAAYHTGPLPFAKFPNVSVFTKQLSYRDEINKTLKKIPQSASVAATNNIGSHLARRELLFTIPIGLYEADYVAFLVNDIYAQPTLDAQKQMAISFKANSDYMLIHEKEDFLLFKKISQ